LWFSEHSTGKIVKFNPNGNASLFVIPSPGAFVLALAPGPDGNVWFPVSGQAFVGRIKPAGKIKLFATPTSNSNSNDTVAGPDGRLWFVTNFNGLGRTTTAGKTDYLPVLDNNDQPTGITVGPDGNIWYVEWGQPAGGQSPSVGRMKTNGTGVKEFDVGFGTFSNSFGIESGADGNIWFADPQRHRIGRIATNGTGQTFFTTGLTGDPITIIAGPDGNLYFGETQGRVGRITTAGVITEFGIPGAEGTSNFPVLGLTVGPDGNIWFANDAHAQIGRLKL
jgi:streptogramin lyase